MKTKTCTCRRSRVIEFLIQSAQILELSPIVKYSALSIFADRFYPALSSGEDILLSKRMFGAPKYKVSEEAKRAGSWLLNPVRECNLQLFVLVSIWISSKIHDACHISVKKLKTLGDKYIKEQHFTMRDYLEAEMVLMQVLEFAIGTSNIAFSLVEDLINQLKLVARVGELVNFEACMDIMDLLYEKDETSLLFRSPSYLAASIVVAAYVITVPVQSSEFPVLPWVKFVTRFKEEDILDIVRFILKHIYNFDEEDGSGLGLLRQYAVSY